MGQKEVMIPCWRLEKLEHIRTVAIQLVGECYYNGCKSGNAAVIFQRLAAALEKSNNVGT